jgi:hypothetical protein
MWSLEELNRKKMEEVGEEDEDTKMLRGQGVRGSPVIEVAELDESQLRALISIFLFKQFFLFKIFFV